MPSCECISTHPENPLTGICELLGKISYSFTISNSDFIV